MKICTRCGTEKPLNDYYFVNKKKSDRRISECKVCFLERSANYQRNNKDKHLEADRRWREANPDKRKQAANKWSRNNSEKRNAITKKWALDNPNAKNKTFLIGEGGIQKECLYTI